MHVLFCPDVRVSSRVLACIAAVCKHMIALFLFLDLGLHPPARTHSHGDILTRAISRLSVRYLAVLLLHVSFVSHYIAHHMEGVVQQLYVLQVYTVSLFVHLNFISLD